MVRVAGRAAVFPYTTLFRSEGRGGREVRGDAGAGRKREGWVAAKGEDQARIVRDARIGYANSAGIGDDRAEDHTSELQSRRHVECGVRLIIPTCAAVNRDLL